MKVNWALVYYDIMVLACFGIVYYRFMHPDLSGLKFLWIFLGIYFLIKNGYGHYKFFKETKRFY